MPNYVMAHGSTSVVQVLQNLSPAARVVHPVGIDVRVRERVVDGMALRRAGLRALQDQRFGLLDVHLFCSDLAPARFLSTSNGSER